MSLYPARTQPLYRYRVWEESIFPLFLACDDKKTSWVCVPDLAKTRAEARVFAHGPRSVVKCAPFEVDPRDRPPIRGLKNKSVPLLRLTPLAACPATGSVSQPRIRSEIRADRRHLRREPALKRDLDRVGTGLSLVLEEEAQLERLTRIDGEVGTRHEIGDRRRRREPRSIVDRVPTTETHLHQIADVGGLGEFDLRDGQNILTGVIQQHVHLLALDHGIVTDFDLELADDLHRCSIGHQLRDWW